MREVLSLLFKTLEQLKNLSMEIKVPLSDIAIAYLLHKNGVSTVIVGATKAEQVLSNANVVAKQAEDVMKRLDCITDEPKNAMGKNCVLWQVLLKENKHLELFKLIVITGYILNNFLNQY